ncbi:MAG: hypothetical protein C0594_04465 [Marinilabiliales bacterium]|nr:MAG: hypothetical protein C0594_04465 [Marinilabiliales bacterium]
MPIPENAPGPALYLSGKNDMKKVLSNNELYAQNIIGVKVIKQQRKYNQTLGGSHTKEINRTVYLKLCWFSGSPYESHKMNSFACSKRCSQNITRQRKAGLNPPARMDVLTKEKNVKEVLSNQYI